VERRVIVTGAGSGIGRATALEAARLGFGVVAAVRREAQVDEVERAVRDADVKVLVEVLDVTDDDRATEIIERYTPWGLVNAAGLLSPGFLADTPPSEARLHLDVMVLAPLRLGQLALPSMRASGGGRIVNVSSFLGDERLPMLGWYQAANQALNVLSGRLRAELAHDGVEVVLIEPGPHATPLWSKARSSLLQRRGQSPEPDAYDRTSTALAAIERAGGDPDKVATVIGAALHAGHPRSRYRIGPSTPATMLARALPPRIRDRVTRTVAGT
jgi:NAD(P)-dependent dehydrogenase (short-subunit alcohol dehydrogenase family)